MKSKRCIHERQSHCLLDGSYCVSSCPYGGECASYRPVDDSKEQEGAVNYKPFIYRVKGDFQGYDAKKALSGEFPFDYDVSKLTPAERGKKLADLSMERTNFDRLVALDNPFADGIAQIITKKILGDEPPDHYQLMIYSIEYLGDV